MSDVDLVELLLARADEIEHFADDPDALPPSGKDSYTAQLLRQAAWALANVSE